jgi:hypothetical protein
VTIIVTALGSDTGLFSLGDILTSAPGYPGVGLPLPLQFDSLARSSGGYGLSGFAQKLTLVTANVLVSWAGSYITARALVERVRLSAMHDDHIDLAAVVSGSGLSDAEVAEVSLILHQVVGDRIEIQCLNAARGEVDGIDAAWQGSGAFDFLHDTVIDAGGPASGWQVLLRSLLTRAASTLAEEALYGSPYDYLYGGWLEMVISRTSGLRKVPYAMKFWGRREEEYGYDAPIFFNWYEGKTLFICSLDQRSGSSDVRTLEIPDLLSGKKWRKVRTTPRYQPEFTFHVVLDDDTGGTEIHISDRHSLGHMSLEVSTNGSYEMKVATGFIDQMRRGAVAPAFVISKRSDVTLLGPN